LETSRSRWDSAPSTALEAFRHEALLYSGPNDFVDSVGSFVSEGVAHGDPVLVVVSEQKIAALRAALGSRADAVEFANMCNVGRNPGRIIPVWQEFFDRHAGCERPVRGVGEPINPDRNADALVECHRHEALINLALDGSGPWWLMCPYDVSALTADVIEEARRNHPYVAHDGRHEPSPVAVSNDVHAHPFRQPLSESPNDALSMEVRGSSDASSVRQFVTRAAQSSGVDPERLDDVALVVGELVANTIRHTDSCALVLTWRTKSAFVCEVRDRGAISDPLVGRRKPATDAIDGRGLWIVHQLGDLVQQRSFPDEHVVRVHFEVAVS
jgi:anti-sigma regulatory factor (Ser/Thr protein kinase)